MLDALCHLHLPQLFARREQVAERAAAAGISRILTASTDPASWDRVLACRAYGPVALGVHPWFAHSELSELEQRCRDEGVEAIGEIGLDALRGDLEEQLPVLRHQLELAARLDLPVILHCVRAHHLLQPELARFGLRGVLHAYSGGPAMVPRYLELGMHFSVGRQLLNARAQRLVASVHAIPPERLLVESDAPDQLAEPAEAAAVVTRLAELDRVPGSRLFG